MNALQLIPAALTLGQDALKLTQALEGGNKAAAVAAVLDVLPVVADITGKPLATLQGLLTEETLGAAFDVGEALEKIVQAVEAKIVA